LSYFVSNNCESTTLLASTCSLNRCVQCHKVGLGCDIVDYGNDLADLCRLLTKVTDSIGNIADGILDLAHTFNGLLNNSKTLTGGVIG